jgi:hypothetical protein
MSGSETSGHEAADKIPSWERAERAYNRVLTTLWISNAGATLATLTYITANRHDGTFTRSLLVPLVLFTLGLTIPGMSSLVEFEWRHGSCLTEARMLSVERRSWSLRSNGELPQRWHLRRSRHGSLCGVAWHDLMPRLREPLVSGRDVAWLMTGHGTLLT